MLILGYLAQTLRRPLPIRKAGPCAPWPMRPTILSHYRKIGVGPIGTELLNSSWIWRTRQLNSPCFMIGSLISKCRHAETSTYARGSSRGDCRSLIQATRRSNAALFMFLAWRSDFSGGSDVLVGELLPRTGLRGQGACGTRL